MTIKEAARNLLIAELDMISSDPTLFTFANQIRSVLEDEQTTEQELVRLSLANYDASLTINQDNSNLDSAYANLITAYNQLQKILIKTGKSSVGRIILIAALSSAAIFTGVFLISRKLRK